MKKKQNASQQKPMNGSGSSNNTIPNETWITTPSLDISFNPNDFSILVTEQAPLPYRITFCGGGARIPAHIGAFEELTKRGLKFKAFSGSSAGALIATLAYLGYNCAEINEIISWFDEDKLLDAPINLSLNTLQSLIQKGGVSSAKSLHQAANYVILNKVMDFISNEKYKHRFAGYQQFLNENIFDCPGCITFETLVTLKKICPECELGDQLYITGTDLSSKQSEIFTQDTTPGMGVADAIIISANLPLAFERIHYNGKKYSDGGITNNFPVDSFLDKSESSVFLSHKCGVDYTVIGLQFDNGHENEALYSQKPVHTWSWLSTQFYGYVTGHYDATDNWRKDLEALRRHAHQSILIKTPDLSFGKLTLSEELHEMVVESGRKAARDYLDQHGYYIDSTMNTVRNEWMYEKFVHPEELLEYCAEHKQFQILDKLQNAIQSSAYLEKGYKQYLVELCDNMSLSADTLSEPSQKPVIEKNFLQPSLNAMSDTHPKSTSLPSFFSSSHKDLCVLQKHKSDLSIRLFTRLYPILMQNWQKVCPVSGIGEILHTMRVSLFSIESTQKCIQVLIHKLKEINAGHFIVFILKSALTQYEKSNFDFLLTNLKNLHKLVNIIEKKQIHSDDRFYGQWEFDEHDPKRILKYLKNDDLSSLEHILESKRTAITSGL